MHLLNFPVSKFGSNVSNACHFYHYKCSMTRKSHLFNKYDFIELFAWQVSVVREYTTTTTTTIVSIKTSTFFPASLTTIPTTHKFTFSKSCQGRFLSLNCHFRSLLFHIFIMNQFKCLQCCCFAADVIFLERVCPRDPTA